RHRHGAAAAGRSEEGRRHHRSARTRAALRAAEGVSSPNRQRYAAVAWSVVLHGAIIGALAAKVDFRRTPQPASLAIEAVVVDETLLASVERQRADEERAREEAERRAREEEARRAAEEREAAERAERERQAEQ